MMRLWRIVVNDSRRIYLSSFRDYWAGFANSSPRGLGPGYGRRTPSSVFSTSCRLAGSNVEVIKVTEDKKNLTLRWNDGEESSFHSKWLRFNCQCSLCNDHTSSSRIIPTQDVPLDTTIESVHMSEDGNLTVRWNEEDHDGMLSTEQLHKNSYSDANWRRLRNQSRMQFYTETSVPQISWTDVQKSEHMFYRWLRYIGDHGICLLTDVPPEHHYMKNVLSTIGHLTGTLYGENVEENNQTCVIRRRLVLDSQTLTIRLSTEHTYIFDVKLSQDAINAAYKPHALFFHMDLAIYEAQPGIQFLHCLRFDDTIKGGETLFVDMFHIAEEFRKEYPEEFRILTKVPFTFTRIHYTRDDPVHMILRRPMIYLNDEDEIINITWHEHEMGPPMVNENNVEQFYRAYQLFARAIDKFQHKRAVRLRKGDMICFNNRRIAHARNAFSGEGGRHLQGSYVNSDDFKSKLMYLSEKLDGGRPVSRVGNNDWT